MIKTTLLLKLSKLKHGNDVKLQRVHLKRKLPQKSGPNSELFAENQTSSKPVLCLNNSQNNKNETRGTNNDKTATCTADDRQNGSLTKIT